MADNSFVRRLYSQSLDSCNIQQLSIDASKGHLASLEQLLEIANGGNGDAQLEIGFLYYKGLGVPQCVETAKSWYFKAAEKGVLNALFNIGILHYKGDGFPRNYRKAVAYLHKADIGGHPRAAGAIFLIRETVEFNPLDSGPFRVKPDMELWIKNFITGYEID